MPAAEAPKALYLCLNASALYGEIWAGRSGRECCSRASTATAAAAGTTPWPGWAAGTRTRNWKY